MAIPAHDEFRAHDDWQEQRKLWREEFLDCRENRIFEAALELKNSELK